MGAIPALGQHSEAILAELGFDAGTILEWKNKHVV
jgi:crotonobetainyl-CoA:carnitine CoA-transferase CaiB-like acyl-CoA transferase